MVASLPLYCLQQSSWPKRERQIRSQGALCRPQTAILEPGTARRRFSSPGRAQTAIFELGTGPDSDIRARTGPRQRFSSPGRPDSDFRAWDGLRQRFSSLGRAQTTIFELGKATDSVTARYTWLPAKKVNKKVQDTKLLDSLNTPFFLVTQPAATEEEYEVEDEDEDEEEEEEEEYEPTSNFICESAANLRLLARRPPLTDGDDRQAQVQPLHSQKGGGAQARRRVFPHLLHAAAAWSSRGA